MLKHIRISDFLYQPPNFVSEIREESKGRRARPHFFRFFPFLVSLIPFYKFGASPNLCSFRHKQTPLAPYSDRQLLRQEFFHLAFRLQRLPKTIQDRFVLRTGFALQYGDARKDAVLRGVVLTPLLAFDCSRPCPAPTRALDVDLRRNGEFRFSVASRSERGLWCCPFGFALSSNVSSNRIGATPMRGAPTPSLLLANSSSRPFAGNLRRRHKSLLAPQTCAHLRPCILPEQECHAPLPASRCH